MSPNPHPGISWRTRLRSVFSCGLTPPAIGWGMFVGGVVAVCPFPGLHTVICIFAAWRCRLNIGLLLLMSNLSFGPLLVVWAGINAGLGRWMREGGSLAGALTLYLHDLEGVHGLRALFSVLGHVYGDWVLGSLVLMPAVGLLFGVPGYLFARWWQRRADSALPVVSVEVRETLP